MIFKQRFDVGVLLLVAMVIMCCDGQRNPITLVNGGYKDLLIAIRKDVPENTTIIDQLKVNDHIFFGGGAGGFNSISWVMISAIVNNVYVCVCTNHFVFDHS